MLPLALFMRYLTSNYNLTILLRFIYNLKSLLTLLFQLASIRDIYKAVVNDVNKNLW